MKTQLIATCVLLFLITLIFSPGCEPAEPSDLVNQDRIYTEFELFYNANEDKTYARGVFRFGNSQGTLLELAGNSEATFNGDILTKTIEPITNFTLYQKEYAGFVDQGTFAWTDTEGKTITNDISVHTIQYPDTVTDIDRSSSYELIWKGDPLGMDEKVVVTVDGDTLWDARVFVQDDLNSQSIIFPKNQLTQLPASNARLFMDRHYEPALMEATGAGGRLTGRYRPVNVVVKVK